MARKVAAAKTSKINRTAAASSSQLERYCRDLDGWPRSWMGWEKDLPPGEKLVACFRPFLEHLVCSDLSRKTIQKHVDNMWVLGGEMCVVLILDIDMTVKPRGQACATGEVLGRLQAPID